MITELMIFISNGDEYHYLFTYAFFGNPPPPPPPQTNSLKQLMHTHGNQFTFARNAVTVYDSSSATFAEVAPDSIFTILVAVIQGRVCAFIDIYKYKDRGLFNINTRVTLNVVEIPTAA